MPTAYITAPREAADELAALLIEERLAACVNVVDCESTYRWDDEVHHDSESILLAKTTTTAYDRLTDRVVEVHPYDVPCIERFEEGELFGPFEAWRDDAVD